MRARRILQRTGAVVGALGLSVTALAGVQLVTAQAGQAAAFPKDYSPESSPGGPGIGYGLQTYASTDPLSPNCPNAIADTPGSGPASNKINTLAGLTPPNSTEAGGTIHYAFNDNGIGPFKVQVCQVDYPAGTFTAAEFNPDGTFVAGASPSKSTLDKGTEVDGAELSGIVPASGNVYYEWTFCNGAAGAPCSGTSLGGVKTGDWVCQFARDVSDQHSGGGNRKAAPVCFQVTAPALKVDKTGPANANVGDSVTYPVTVSNNAKSGATGIETQEVTLTDDTPAGLIFTGETHPAGWSCTDPALGGLPGSGTLTCTKAASSPPATPTMAFPEEDDFTVTYTVDASAANTTVTNNATASSSDGGTSTGTAKTKVAAAGAPIDAALGITKASTSSSVAAIGGTAEYTITVVSTEGKDAAGHAVVPEEQVTDTLPAGTWTIASQTFPAAHLCSINLAGTTLTCDDPALPGGTYDVVIDSPTSGGMCPSISNSATVTSTGPGTVDLAPAAVPGGAAAGVTPASVITLTGCAPAVDLGKSADAASVTAGNPVSFLITAFVTGATPALNLDITDDLPSNTGLWSINTAAGAIPGADFPFTAAACGIAGPLGTQVLTCNEGSLAGTSAAQPAGTTYAVDVISTTNDTSSCSGISNVASATLGTGTLTPAGGTTPAATTSVTGCPVAAGGGGGGGGGGGPTTTTTVAPTTTTTAGCPPPEVAGPDGSCVLGESLAPDPVITKTADAVSVLAGQPIGFTITLTNPGTASTTATISDPLPSAAGLSWSIDSQPANGPTCSIANNTLTCGPATLPVGAKWAVHIISPTTMGSVGTVNNTVSVTSPNLSAPLSASASETVTAVLGTTISAPAGVATAVKTLPFTGANTARLLGIGAASALIGVILMLLGRRPEDEVIPARVEDPLGRF